MIERTARVVFAGPEQHPSSGRNLMYVEVDLPYPWQGPPSKTTGLWIATTIEPQTGEKIRWRHRQAWIRGVQYAKPYDDSNPALPLH